MAPRKSTKHIVLHCSATRASQNTTAAEIRKWHLDKGWNDIGYHYVIRRDGTLENGRKPDTSVGSHVAGHNSNTLGICLVGGLSTRTGKPENNFTDAQWDTLRELLGRLTEKFPSATILGHRDLSPDKNRDGVISEGEWLKACPCFDASTWAHDNGFPGALTRKEAKKQPAPEAPPKPLVQSKIAQGGGIVATYGGSEVLQGANEAADQVRQIKETAGDIGILEWLTKFASNPKVIMGVAIIVIAGAIIYWRWREHGRGSEAEA